MPRIIVEPSSGEKTERSLNRDDIATIGRRKQCTVVITDSAVSRHHATIEFVDGAYILRDEGSSNGTLIDDERISEHKLRDGDQFTIGETVLTFREDEPEPAPAPVPAPVPAPIPAPIPAPAAPPPARREPVTAAVRRPPARKRSGRRQREEPDAGGDRAGALKQENLVKIVSIAISGVAFIVIVALFVRIAFPSNGDGSDPRVVHRNPQKRIRTLQSQGRKFLAEKDYRQALDRYEACFNLCQSLRAQPPYQGPGFYWLEQTMMECNTKIRECREQLFRRDMRERRGVD